MQTATLSSKGQLVIPSSIRQLAHMSAGDAFTVQYADGEVRIRPVAKKRVSALADVVGCLATAGLPPMTDQETNEQIMQMLWEQDEATKSPKARAAGRKATAKRALAKK
jgi:AbrB family looped-hinge helix DNA binding protein